MGAKGTGDDLCQLETARASALEEETEIAFWNSGKPVVGSVLALELVSAQLCRRHTSLLSVPMKVYEHGLYAGLDPWVPPGDVHLHASSQV